MITYFNMDKSLIRNGGRSAYRMDLEQFKQLLDEGLKRFNEDYDVSWEEGDPVEALRKCLICEATEQAHYGDIEADPFMKAAADMDKIQMDYENVIVEDIFVADNGVPVVQMIIGGDWERGVQVFLYWDGKTFRGYVPTYGNSFNRYSKCAFGSEEGESHFGKKYFIQSDEPAVQPFLPEGTPFPMTAPAVIVLNEENYEEFPMQNVFPCTEACLEDFCSRVTVKGDLPQQMFEKGMAVMRKLSTKPLYEDDDE